MHPHFWSLYVIRLSMDSNINCLKCKHYYSTYDQKSPRGCRFYRFHSPSFPSLVVKRQSGSDCMGYELRQKPKEKGKLDLNDPKLWD